MISLRTLRSHASALSVAAALLATVAPTHADDSTDTDTDLAPQPTARSGQLLADLRKGATTVTGYGTWRDHLNPSKDGVVVLGGKGAQGDGGFCVNAPAPFDLSGMSYVDVAIASGQLNEVPELTLALNDSDGTMTSARIRIDQVAPRQPVWYRVPLANFQAAAGEHGGLVPGFDMTKIAQWHVQGDWATKKPLQIVVIALRARR
ncbi:MAG TPA: hypothetical protein VK178_18645 [Opitutaceae bacterium]|nr:hypothetical protein [Opitutaceae bacterium]